MDKFYLRFHKSKNLFNEILDCSKVADQNICTSKLKQIDVLKIIDETFYQKTYVQNQILGRVLTESILFMDGKCIAGIVSQKMMRFYDAKPTDLEGIVNQLLYTRGVEVAIFMHEIMNWM